ncbi:MAG TPA: tetratricopeptide repeat protein [Alphaproteobacteria bacterium]|nr:tetratricopeptide repeat protein [Alphaproteobacteria bacterium]
MNLGRELRRTAALIGLVGVMGIGALASAPHALAESRSNVDFDSDPGADAEALRWGNYLAGRSAQLDHDWRNAGRLMRQVWSADRTNASLRHEALLLTLAGGDFAAAADIARAVPTDSGDAVLAHVILATDDLDAGRYAAARQRIDALPSEGVERYLKPLLAAWTEVGRGRKAQALAELQPVNALPGASELYNLQSALVAEATGDPAAAASFYDKLLDAKPSTRALIVAAEFYQRHGSTDKARAAIEKLDPDGASSSVRTEMLKGLGGKGHTAPAPNPKTGAAAAFFDVASSLALQDQGDLGPLLYDQLALHLAPNFSQAQVLLAEFDQHWGRLDDAVAVLESVDPNSSLRSTALRDAVGDLDKLNRLDDAIKLARATVAAHPEDLDLALLEGDLLRQAQRFPEAIAAYDGVLARAAPTSGRRGIALYHRGIAYERAHDWPHAEADLLAALLLRPDDPGLLNYLAFSWADQGINLDRARTMLDRAIQLLPDDGAIVDSLGWVMFRQGDYEDAVKQLERAVELDADDATVNDHLGDAYWRVGRQIEARSQWERAARLTDDKTLATQLRAKLKDGLDTSAPRRASAD